MKNFSKFLKTACSALLISFAGTMQADYPAFDGFTGAYDFKADLQLENKSLSSVVKDNFTFTVTAGYGDPVINDFMSNQPISTVYDAETGALKLQTNTIRYGELPKWQYLGIADADGNWTGMGAISKTPVYWQVSEDGHLSIPDFTLVDYSNYSKNGKVTVVARFSNCTATLNTEEEEEEKTISFEGFYTFIVDKTANVYETVRDDKGVDHTTLVDVIKTTDEPMTFVINEYQQISNFNNEYLMEAEQLNSLRNRGYVKGNDYIMDADMYNGIGWNYDTSNEDEAKTEALLFNSLRANDWIQGSEAFRIRKNDDGTYKMDSFSIWFRTIENREGAEDQVNRMRVFRLERTYENVRFVSFSDEIPEPDLTPEPDPEPDPETIELYLVGDNYGNWSTVEEDYHFTRDENVYTLELDSLEGEWKIWDGTWGFNFGCGASQPRFNHETISYFDAGKFNVNSEIPVTITFTLVEGSAEKGTNIGSRILISRDESALNGIGGIENETGAVRYFNLQGIEIDRPSQGIYIKVGEGKSTLVNMR